MRMSKGKIVVGVIAVFLALFVAGIVEFNQGIIQKTVYTYKVKHYLKQTYNEPMEIKRVNYLWDNIEPISARISPQNLKNIEFSVFPNKESATGFRDDYAHTLWLYQAKEDVDKRLLAIDQDFRSQLYLDFVCCTTSSLDSTVKEGNVPSYTDVNEAFDVTFQLNRAMKPQDPEQIIHIIEALKQHDQPKLGTVLFLLEPEGKAYRIEYRIPGASLKDISTVADLKNFNESRFPARELAAIIDAEISWDASDVQAEFTKRGTVLQFKNWGNEVLVNGIPIQNPLPSFQGDQGNLLVPVTIVEQAFQVEIPLIEPFK